jgi:hypothetical protein
MTALAIMIRPTDTGWAVCLTNGQELIRYRGLFSKRLALRYLQRCTEAHSIPGRYRDRSES